MSEQNQSPEETVRSFLQERFQIAFDKDDVTSETNLIEAGLIDSYAVIELAVFLEDSFNFQLSNEQMASPKLATLKGIVELVSLQNAAE